VEVESADDAVIEEAELLPQPPPPPRPGPRPELPAATPPPVPHREVRDSLTDADRLFVERTFQSIADRRDALLAESQRNRPPPRRDLLQTADGRMQLLRDDLKAREAQIARLAEIWDIREREVSYAGEWLHEKDVELQGLKGQVEDLSGRLAEARALLVTKEREHGASIDAMLLEKATQEKELIELVAGAERGLHDAERRHETAWRAIEERLATVEGERRALEEQLAAAESVRRALEERLATAEDERGAMEARAASLAASLAAEGARATAIEAELGEVRSAAEVATADAARRAEELQADVAERDRVLAAAKRENDRLQAELTAARHEYMVSESEAQAARDRAEKADELAQQLEQALRAREGALPPTEPPPTAAETTAAETTAAEGPDEPRGVDQPAGASPVRGPGGEA
jgi:ParB family chromosome partitioning protein